MKIWTILLCFCLLLLSCGYTTISDLGSPDNCRFRADRGFIIKWRDLPIPIYTHTSLPPLTRKNFIYALDIWNEAWNYHTSRGPLFELMGGTDVHYNPLQEGAWDEINIIYLDQKYYFLDKEKQATTYTNNAFGGIMLEADIIFNGIHQKWYYEKEDFDYLAWTKVPALSTARYLASVSTESFWKRFLYAFQGALDFLAFWRKKMERVPSSDRSNIGRNESDFISVAIHELGHHAGLGHIDDRKSIMNTRLLVGTTRRDIGEFELASLACGYQIQAKKDRALASTPSKEQSHADSFWKRFLSRLSTWIFFWQ